MTYRNEMKRNNGPTRVVLVITIVFVAFWSYLMLDAQINDTMFIHCNEGVYTMEMTRCLALLLGYGVCFAPITGYWISDGFKQYKYL